MKRAEARQLLKKWFPGCKNAIESEGFAKFLEQCTYSSKSQCAYIAQVYMAAVLTDNVKAALFFEIESDPQHVLNVLARKIALGVGGGRKLHI